MKSEKPKKPEKDPVLFGVSYYEKSFTKERLERDLTLIENGGFSVIRLCASVWNDLDGNREEYDFSQTDSIIKAADERGIYVILGLSALNEELFRAVVSHNAGLENVIGFELDCSPGGESLKWQKSIIEEYKRRDQFITGDLGSAYEKNKADTDAVSVAGTCIRFKGQDDHTGSEISFMGDLTRSLKKGTYLVLDNSPETLNDWPPYPGQLSCMAFNHIASGAGSIIFPFFSKGFGLSENGRIGLLGHDGEENETFREACTVSETLKNLTPDIGGLRKKNNIAIVMSSQSGSIPEHFSQAFGLSYNDALRWVYDALYEMNFETDIIFDSDSFKGYKLLIFPGLYSADDSVISKTDRFVKTGGVVFATFGSFFTDERFNIRTDKQPHGLTKVFGMSYSQYTKPVDVYVDGSEALCRMELITTSTAETVSEYDHRYWGRYSAFTRNTYGMGRAYYLGTCVEPARLKKYLMMAAQDAQIPKCAYEFPIVIKAGVNPAGELLLFIFNCSSTGRNMILQWGGTELISNNEFHAGQRIFIRDWGVMILKVGR